MNTARGVFIPPETADTLRDCVQRTLRAFATVNRLRGRKEPYNTGNQLLQREAALDSLLTELFCLTAKIFLPNEDVRATLAASKKNLTTIKKKRHADWRGRKEATSMTDQQFVALDDWQITCNNVADLIDAITELSSRPYSAAALLAELKLVVGVESTNWNKVRHFGFTNRDAAQNAYYAECKRRNI